MQNQLVSVSRQRALRKLERRNGTDYAIVRNQQLQIGKAARDFLKEFAAYVGEDGKGSRSAIKKDENGQPIFQDSGGAVHVAVAKQIKEILGFSAKEMDAVGDPELVSKACLAWAKVKPILEAGAEKRLPRKQCFALLWAKFREIAAV